MKTHKDWGGQRINRFKTGRAASLLASAAFVGAMSPVQGQTAPLPEPAQGVQISDIIVTAQRREERAQDVPIVISAFSPERLRD